MRFSWDKINQDDSDLEKFNLNESINDPDNVVLPLILQLLGNKLRRQETTKIQQIHTKLAYFNFTKHNRLISPLLQDYHRALTTLDANWMLIYRPNKRHPDTPKQQLVQGVLSASILIYDVFSVFEKNSLIPYNPIDSEILADIATTLNQICSSKLQEYNAQNRIDDSYLNEAVINSDNIYQFCLDNFADYLKDKL
ncbi:MAG: hypothetical protein OXF49_01120 [Candidatus Saccharibacteria bacterium]|nr:hypothetical protein [Candidatus Saccharibacteria bacterium]